MRQLLSLFVTIAISAAALPVTLVAAAGSIEQRSDQQTPLSTSSRVVITYGPAPGTASSRSLTPSAESRMVVDLGRTVTVADLESFEGPGVIAVEPDVLLKPLTVPNDPNVGSQWDLSDAASGVADFSIKAPGAWTSTTGDASLVVAVLDTGITTHSEFSGRLVSGYDFVSNTLMGNDGNGREIILRTQETGLQVRRTAPEPSLVVELVTVLGTGPMLRERSGRLETTG